MNLYIETQDGQPVNHPAFEDNLIAAFGEIPSHWEPFVRVERPIPNIYQTLVSQKPTYEKINGVWTDVWQVQEMTAIEKAAKQQSVRDAFNNRPQAENWSAWVLNEEACIMVPPIQRPPIDEEKNAAGIYAFWCGADNNWKDTPAYPKDEKKYKFDFAQWVWVPING